MVLGPAIIGDNVSVGVGAVVVKHTPDNCVLMGVPARPRAGGESPVSVGDLEDVVITA